MNGISIRLKPRIFPDKPEGLRDWVIASLGGNKSDIMGLPKERAELGKPCVMDPAFDVQDDILLHDPMQRPGYDPKQEGLPFKHVIGARRLLVPPRHFPSARTVELIPVYLFRFETLSDTDLIVAHKHYSHKLENRVDEMTETYRTMAGDRIVLVGALPPQPGKS